MAITSLAGIESGTVRSSYLIRPTSVNGSLIRPHNLLYVGGGYPGNASVNSNGLSGAAVTSYTGSIDIPEASNTTYIKAVNVSAANAGIFMLCDLLWHNSGLSLTATTPQIINSVAFAARDSNGSSNGEGVIAALFVTGLTGTGTPQLSLGYTNQAGAASRSSNGVTISASSSLAGASYFFGMQTGDTGIRSIQSYQQDVTWTSGTAHLAAFRPILTVPVYSSVKRYYADITENGLVKIFNSSVLFGLYFSSSGNMNGMSATIEYTQG